MSKLQELEDRFSSFVPPAHWRQELERVRLIRHQLEMKGVLKYSDVPFLAYWIKQFGIE